MDLIEAPQMDGQQALKHWYYQAKFKLLKKYLLPALRENPQASLADFGCGAGIFLKLIRII